MGPLQGFRIVEIASIGPGPFCAMMLSDMGADIIRVDRVQRAPDTVFGEDHSKALLNRGRRSVALDLKNPQGIAAVMRLIAQADALIEGFRPGVMERLGLGPDECLRANPKLVYGRITGWGQDGPLAAAAGHDINYIALSGALSTIGLKDQRPTAPLNLVGDFGGGGMYLAFGIVCALLEAAKSGRGQVVDAAMVDGAASLMAAIYGLRAAGLWSDARGDNLLDTGAPWYDTYETSDGKFVSIGSIEPQFYALLLNALGLQNESLPAQHDRAGWPVLRERFAAAFQTKTQTEWCAQMEGSDICFAPVLTMGEAVAHPHNRARKTFVDIDGVAQPAPAPRFSRTAPEIARGAPAPGAHTEEALRDWGFSAADIAKLRVERVIPPS